MASSAQARPGLLDQLSQVVAFATSSSGEYDTCLCNIGEGKATRAIVNARARSSCTAAVCFQLARRRPRGSDPRDHGRSTSGAGDRHLAAAHAVLAPDLLGHGESAKPRGDYSSAHTRARSATSWSPSATTARRSSATRSAGIAMQFAYQFPERTERLVLVSSGASDARSPAVGRRPPSGPSSFSRCSPIRGSRRPARPSAGRSACCVSRPAPTSPRSRAASAPLGDAEARAAFIATMRAVLDPVASGSAPSIASTWPSRCPRCSSGARPTR